MSQKANFSDCEGDEMRDLEEYMHSGEYLPEFMRDFHDCKDLFKRINEIVSNAKAKDPTRDLPNWITAHIYTVDFFLWYLAVHGYTIQKNRKQIDFIDLEEDLADARNRWLEQFKQELAAEREAREQAKADC